MRGRHFDVIVLGRSFGALVAAALLARRDFSVLVLGQGARDATYRLGERPLRRRPLLLLGATAPALRRALVELAQNQTFRRRTEPLDPMLSVLTPGTRFELPPDRALFEREMNREFPELRRIVGDFYTQLATVNEAADAAFEREVIWPPGTFWERHLSGRAAANLPFLSGKSDPLLDFPALHPYRAVVQQTVAFATDLAPGPRFFPPFAAARLHGSWTRGLLGLPGGEDELTSFLCDRIAAHGGAVALAESADRVLAGRKGFEGVLLGGESGKVSGRFLLFDRSGEELAELAAGEGIAPAALREWPRVSPTVGRFVVSLVVRETGVPAALGREALLLDQTPGLTYDPWRLPLRIHREALPGGEALLVAEALLPLRGSLPLTEARSAVLAVIARYFPWLHRHLVVVDSPHDGLPAWLYDHGKRSEIDRISLHGGSIRPEPMVFQYTVEDPSFHGLGGEPLRGPVGRSFLVGKTVLPALGQEGELLAASSAARLITRSDPRREKMRLEMWNKVEIG
ncbi:MAG: phytoene dehydrogenase [Polyangiaceae bacterium]|jgi:phytoene dehydrogenase-like protein|nr:phytoene dehydrogenase [Polyangiaceae bacterium]